MDEFDLIQRYFVPLTERFSGSLGLRDDAALVDIPAGQQLVVTTDAITSGVHFLGNEDAALIARKLLRVNLSDLAAKGARPLCYFLSLMLPEGTDNPWIERFASGLAEDQQTFGIALAGGDTTAIRGPLALSLTALGTVPTGRMLTRAAARPGDALYVSGQLGDAALGLRALRGLIPHDAALEERYLLPEPRLSLGRALLESSLAHACMDISDGLVQDAGHICTASGVGTVIEAEHVPRGQADLETASTAGDDYELLFSAPQDAAEPVAALAAKLGIAISRIGTITTEKSVTVRDASGKVIRFKRSGYRHFS